jgi:hypothetical protein
MRRSLSPRLALIAILIAVGCSSQQAKRPPLAPAVHQGALAITNGIGIIGSKALPAEFVADLGYAPIWLNLGSEIAVAGSVKGRSALLGLGDPKMMNQHVIAEDSASGASQGRILDVAANPNDPTLALAIAEPDRVVVSLRRGTADDAIRNVDAVAGTFDRGQLNWLDATTIALALHADRNTSAAPDQAAGQNGSGVYLIKFSDPPEVRALGKIQCALSRLSFSPDGRFAVGQGDAATAPVLIDVRSESCAPLGRREPIRVMGWAPDSLAFLYFAAGEKGVPGIFRYDRASGGSAVIAVASGAAAHAADGTIIAVGNERLTWRIARAASEQPVAAQIALLPPGQQEVTINSLGFETTPAWLARASMAFSPSANAGVIDIVAIKALQPTRELIEYSYSARAAFVLAGTTPDAPIGLSWSPDGKMIAIVDASIQPNILTVLAAPR